MFNACFACVQVLKSYYRESYITSCYINLKTKYKRKNNSPPRKNGVNSGRGERRGKRQKRNKKNRLPHFALARGWSVTGVIPTRRDNNK